MDDLTDPLDTSTISSEVLARRQQVATLLWQGKPYAEIAATLGVSMRQVQRDVADLRRRWTAIHDADLAEHRAELLEQLRVTFGEAFQAWQDSRQPKRTTKVRQRESRTASGETTQEVREETTAGDPRFLDIMVKTIAQRGRLTGAIQASDDNPLISIQLRQGVAPEYVERFERFAAQFGYSGQGLLDAAASGNVIDVDETSTRRVDRDGDQQSLDSPGRDPNGEAGALPDGTGL